MNKSLGSESFMNDTLSLLATRRSAPVPFLTAPGPTADQIQTLLTIAARVPDHGKLAPWRFVIFAGAERDRAGAIVAEAFAVANAEADDKRVEIERRRFSAPIVIAVISHPVAHKVPEWEQVLSAGAVCMTLCVAANAMGFATSWLTEWYAYDRGVLERFGLQPEEKIAGFIHIGTPTGPRDERPRPALADIVSNFEG
jgi:nitroreductase